MLTKLLQYNEEMMQLFYNGNYRRAIEGLKLSLELFGHNPETLQLLGEIYYNCGLDEKNQQHYLDALQQLSESLKYFDSIAKQTTESSVKNFIIDRQVEILHTQGDIYILLGNQQKALECFADILILDPRSQYRITYATCLNNLGLEHKNAGQFTEALNYFSLAIKFLKQVVRDSANKSPEELQEKLWHPYFNRGCTYGQLRNYAQAANNFRSCLSLNVDNVLVGKVLSNAYLCHALYLLDEGKPEPAFKKIEQALSYSFPEIDLLITLLQLANDFTLSAKIYLFKGDLLAHLKFLRMARTIYAKLQSSYKLDSSRSN
jgi:tetratricopeptide (TPR) repeat protein